MDRHLGHSNGPDHRCGLVLTFLLRSKCNQSRATVRIQWSLGQQAGRHCGMGCLSDPDAMGVLLRLTVPNGAQSTLSSSMLMYQRPGHSNGHALKFNVNLTAGRSQRSAVDISHSILSTGQ